MNRWIANVRKEIYFSRNKNKENVFVYYLLIDLRIIIFSLKYEVAKMLIAKFLQLKSTVLAIYILTLLKYNIAQV